jgi:hypothetical protein
MHNARALEAIEDAVAWSGDGRRISHVSMEFRGALARETDVELLRETRSVEGGTEIAIWLVTAGEVRASAVVTTVPRDRAP